MGNSSKMAPVSTSISESAGLLGRAMLLGAVPGERPVRARSNAGGLDLTAARMPDVSQNAGACRSGGAAFLGAVSGELASDNDTAAAMALEAARA